MERHKFDQRTGLRYVLQGNYYVIAGEVEAECPQVGIWGQRHLCWLKRNRRVTYTNLLTTGRLYNYLQDINAQANEQFELLIRQLAKAEGVTEQMKAEDQMEWVRRMNSIRNRVEETIYKELIYCYILRGAASQLRPKSFKHFMRVTVPTWENVNCFF